MLACFQAQGLSIWQCKPISIGVSGFCGDAFNSKLSVFINIKYKTTLLYERKVTVLTCIFFLPKNPKNQDLSYKMDVDFGIVWGEYNSYSGLQIRRSNKDNLGIIIQISS